jgi:hypothetical protein
MKLEANTRVKESCMICEGRGRQADSRQNGGRGLEIACAYCDGSGVVFARTGLAKEIIVATGDCKVPMKRKAA